MQQTDKKQYCAVKVRGFGVTLHDFKEQFVNFIRSSVIGIAMGILPGVGGSTSSVLAYMVAKNSSSHPEDFGTGIIDGIVASESANNATIGGHDPSADTGNSGRIHYSHAAGRIHDPRSDAGAPAV